MSIRHFGGKDSAVQAQAGRADPRELDWLTREELASELRVAVRTVDYWRKRRLISHTKIGRVIRFRRSQVLQELAAFERKAIASR
jgi:excisionase family DNA binding protein